MNQKIWKSSNLNQVAVRDDHIVIYLEHKGHQLYCFLTVVIRPAGYAPKRTALSIIQEVEAICDDSLGLVTPLAEDNNIFRGTAWRERGNGILWFSRPLPVWSESYLDAIRCHIEDSEYAWRVRECVSATR